MPTKHLKAKTMYLYIIKQIKNKDKNKDYASNCAIVYKIVQTDVCFCILLLFYTVVFSIGYSRRSPLLSVKI